MKKIFGFLSILAMSVLMAACGSNNDKPEHTATCVITDQNVEVAFNGAAFHKASCDIAMEMNYTERTVNLTFNKITFAPRMPEITFSLTGAKLTYSDDNHIAISSDADLVPMDGYVVRNLKGYADFDNDLVFLAMDIVARGNTYATTITTPMLYSYPQTGNKVEYNATEMMNLISTKSIAQCTDTYFVFYLPTVSTPGGSINIHNISFVAAMPKIAELRIPLSAEHITSTATGYSIEAAEIVPEFLSGSVWTPMDTRTVTNLVANVNYAANSYSIEFDCYGMHYTNGGKLYNYAVLLATN